MDQKKHNVGNISKESKPDMSTRSELPEMFHRKFENRLQLDRAIREYAQIQKSHIYIYYKTTKVQIYFCKNNRDNICPFYIKMKYEDDYWVATSGQFHHSEECQNINKEINTIQPLPLRCFTLEDYNIVSDGMDGRVAATREALFNIGTITSMDIIKKARMKFRKNKIDFESLPIRVSADNWIEYNGEKYDIENRHALQKANDKQQKKNIKENKENKESGENHNNNNNNNNDNNSDNDSKINHKIIDLIPQISKRKRSRSKSKKNEVKDDASKKRKTRKRNEL